MIAAIYIVGALAAAPLAPAGGELDELILHARLVRSFSATYTLTTSKSEDATTLRIDYARPGRIRVDKQSAQGGSSTWCVDGVITLRSQGEQPVHGSVSHENLVAGLDPIRKTLDHGFPPDVAHSADPLGPTAALSMRWWFDHQAQKANFAVEPVWAEAASEPFGWLTTLSSGHGAPTLEGEQLRFASNDGAFHIALARRTGFVESLEGKSQNGEFRLALKELAVDTAIDPARFELPSGAPSGRDVTRELAKGFAAVAARDLRATIYARIAGSEGEPWDEPTREKIKMVLRLYNMRAIEATLDTWRESARRKRDGVVERLRKLAETQTPEELDRIRHEEFATLTKVLDELQAGFDERLVMPQSRTPLPRGEPLLAIEHEILAEIFEQTVRRPLLADFERAIGLKRE